MKLVNLAVILALVPMIAGAEESKVMNFLHNGSPLNVTSEDLIEEDEDIPNYDTSIKDSSDNIKWLDTTERPQKLDRRGKRVRNKNVTRENTFPIRLHVFRQDNEGGSSVRQNWDTSTPAGKNRIKEMMRTHNCMRDSFRSVDDQLHFNKDLADFIQRLEKSGRKVQVNIRYNFRNPPMTSNRHARYTIELESSSLVDPTQTNEVTKLAEFTAVGECDMSVKLRGHNKIRDAVAGFIIDQNISLWDQHAGKFIRAKQEKRKEEHRNELMEQQLEKYSEGSGATAS
jgi:hypothetical protein